MSELVELVNEVRYLRERERRHMDYIAELEAQCGALQNKCATRGLSPEDSDALEADNERLRAAMNALIHGLWDKHSLFISLTLEQHGLDSEALKGADDE